MANKTSSKTITQTFRRGAVYERPTKMLTARVYEDEQAKYNAHAERRGVPLAELIRRLLDEDIERHETRDAKRGR